MKGDEPVISVRDLKKSFRVPVAKEHDSWRGRIKSLFYREWKDIEILKGLNFEIYRGEFVGYIGANGAGKSTTIKALTGILCPDGGQVSCVGFDPYRERYNYTYNIGVVFGQKSILEYEVPVEASFELYKRIYEMDDQEYKKRLGFFDEILSIGELKHVPVRKLSFGQRMRCEVAASLLHNPQVVFLDEPTIGLDASAKKEIREFLKTVNEVDQTTVILTTHDMKDIESLCRRVMLIDKGQLIYDGDLEKLRDRVLSERTVKFRLDEVMDSRAFNDLRSKATFAKKQGESEVWTLDLKQLDLSETVRALLQCARFVDLSVTEPELEDVVEHLYANPEALKVKNP
jgi:ABC-2 type transport system ATP-binding protein